ncbi:hypothetical protein ACFY36_04185 [Actinoplanes sp. NPDC000266]
MTMTLFVTSAPASAVPNTPVKGTSCASSKIVMPSASWNSQRASLPSSATEDITQLATQKGISVAQAIDDYGWHESLSQVVGQVQEAFPGEYGGARIVDDGQSRAWVAFADDAPASALDMLRASPVPVAVRTGCGFSEAELKQRLEQVHYSVLGRTDVVADASSGYDIETGAITVMVQPSAVARGRLADLRSNLTAGLPAGNTDLPVEVQIVSDVVGGDDITVYGGRGLSGGCTTGFNVIWSMYRGTTTAAHCGNAQSYAGVALTFVSEHSGNYGDVQVHRAVGHSFPNQFYANTGYRAVTGTGAAITGQQMCLQGNASGYHCDTVYQLAHCNGSRCGLVAMNTRSAAGGDSGGAWFSNNRAYGIHQGYKYWFGNRDLYTPVVYLPTSLGVTVALY